MIIDLIIKQGWLLRPTGHGYADALLTTAFLALPLTLALASLTYAAIERPFLTLRNVYTRPEAAGPHAHGRSPAAPP